MTQLPLFFASPFSIQENGFLSEAEVAANDFLSHGEANWAGAPELLEEFGVKAGQAVAVDALREVLDGGHAVAPWFVREKNDAAQLQRERDRRAADRSESHRRDIVPLQGVLVVPILINSAWRDGDAARKAEIERALFDSTEAGIRSAAGAEHTGAATRLRIEGTAAAPRLEVDWLAFAAADGDKVVAPYARGNLDADGRTLTPEAKQRAERAAAAPLKDLVAPEHAVEGQLPDAQQEQAGAAEANEQIEAAQLAEVTAQLEAAARGDQGYGFERGM